ncbi:trypsin-like serine peptidase [Kitasatospora sp. NPDC059973]|uniref:trypsin-like serine peptidase n=1 Tax=Kitasatospora sp. NPDC059973 TaxID=3347020 RepID=UPI0036CCE2F2
MGQHRRLQPRRRLLAPTLLTLLSVLTVAAVVTGAHSVTSEVTAAGSPTVTAPAAATSSPSPSPAPSSSASAPDAAPDAAAPAATGAPTDGAAGEATTDQAAAEAPTDPATAVTVPGPLGTTAVAPATPESATVGALFSGKVTAGDHFCTASVLHSTTRNLLITAAHCLDSAAGVTFVPGYRDGAAPYGTWRVTAIHTTTGWSRDGDQDEDFAVLETASDGGRRIEDVVGANQLGTDEPFGVTVRLYGYPSGTEAALLCGNTTGRQSTYQRVVDCPGYPGGTSGGPWISTATGHVVGVIGGYREGGDSPDTSYSAAFDHTVAALYEEAVDAAS